MELEHLETLWEAAEDGVAVCLLGEDDRVEADLRLDAAIDVRAERRSEELGAEADAEKRHGRRPGLLDELLLGREPRMTLIVEDTLGPAHCDEDVERAGARNAVLRHDRDVGRDASRGEDVQER